QIDLESTRQELANQCKKLISEFGKTEVSVKMSLEKRSQIVPPKGQADDSQAKVATGSLAEVVANGKGKISVPLAAASSATAAEVQTVLIKRLLGIEVSIQKNVVDEYLKKHMGLITEATGEQFSRGVVAVRNEITKTIVSWIRNQGIDVSSDVVSVSVMPAEFQEELVSDAPEGFESASAAYYSAGGIVLAVVSILVALTWKSRSPEPQPAHQFSDAGREFVMRNQVSTGSGTPDEVGDVIQFDSDRPVQAFQELASSEVNP
ncbi:MAG: hypothetical protein VX438_17300, partial [Planctomycetota bacterium]|nr:hypothetical protein [Planctomycetota bacterium]